jgi:hypothetical protein
VSLLTRLKATYLSRGGEYFRERLLLTGKVLAGPFSGLKYINQSYCSVLTAKLLGTYELELYPFIEQIICSPPTEIIIVGAAEGYFACGFAFRLPQTKVFAFEADPTATSLLLQLAKRNEISNVVTLGEATESNFREILLRYPEAPIIMDVEGFESTLINHDTKEYLSNRRLIVELHHDACELVPALFPNAAVVTQRLRKRSDLPSTPDFSSALFPTGLAVHLMNESRPVPQTWLVHGFSQLEKPYNE